MTEHNYLNVDFFSIKNTLKYANFFEIGIWGFHELYAKIISIKTIKDLKYFSWCAMNLKYMKV